MPTTPTNAPIRDLVDAFSTLTHRFEALIGSLGRSQQRVVGHMVPNKEPERRCSHSELRLIGEWRILKTPV
jgi:hypothetical protein